MNEFRIHRPYQPQGDQPQAIEELVDGLEARRPAPGAARRYGLGQDLHDRQRDRRDRAADARPVAQQDAGGPALRGVQGASSRTTRSGTSSRYYDYYQPEAYVPATDTYIEKDAIDQRRHRPHAAARRPRCCSSARTSSSSPRSRASTASARPATHGHDAHLAKGASVDRDQLLSRAGRDPVLAERVRVRRAARSACAASGRDPPRVRGARRCASSSDGDQIERISARSTRSRAT